MSVRPACVVFSRDRALQLEAFLRTMRDRIRYATTTVLFRTSDARYAEGYDQLAATEPHVDWVEETRFSHDLRRIVADVDEPWIVFHTDDDVFFGDVPDFEIRDDEECFTLRLGLNTTYCYPLDSPDVVQNVEIEPDRISWNWREQAPGAYSYPLALNGHVFRVEEVRGWVDELQFTNPNELEAALQSRLGELGRERMSAFPISKVVSIPDNLVNDVYKNRHADSHTPAELNLRFLRGERLNVSQMDFADVTSCHQEIDFVFTE